MAGTILDGKALAVSLRERLKGKVQALKAQGCEPAIATILVGEDPASRQYVGSKQRAAVDVGIKPLSYEMPEDTSAEALSKTIRGLTSDRAVNGILLQLPLPRHLDYREMLEQIGPEKDVDGLTTTSLGKLMDGKPSFVPCTPLGIMTLLEHYDIPLEGKNVVIVNRSILVGKPLFHLFLAEDSTVTMCHSKSSDVLATMKRADVLVTAVGRRPGFVVSAEMVKEGAVVVDVGMNRVKGRTVGDVDFSEVSQKASYITPVPGGVGPMTIAMLLQNTVMASDNQLKAKTLAAPPS